MKSDMDLKEIRSEIDEAIAAIGEKYGFTASLGMITYNEIGFHSTLTAKIIESPSGKSGAQVEYEMYARKFGIDPTTFGKHFITMDKEYIIVGIAPKARKFPIIAKNVSTGIEFKFEKIGKVIENG